MRNSLERPMESYIYYPPIQYNRKEPSAVEGYAPPNINRRSYEDLPEEARDELDSLVLQGSFNWPEPEYDTPNLIADRANIDIDDVSGAIHKLCKDKTLVYSHNRGFTLNIGEPVTLTPPAA